MNVRTLAVVALALALFPVVLLLWFAWARSGGPGGALASAWKAALHDPLLVLALLELALLHLTLALKLARDSRRLGLSAPRGLAWSVAAAIFGVFAWWAFVAARPERES